MITFDQLIEMQKGNISGGVLCKNIRCEECPLYVPPPLRFLSCITQYNKKLDEYKKLNKIKEILS